MCLILSNYLTDEEDFVFFEDLRKPDGRVVEGRGFNLTGCILKENKIKIN